MNSSLTTYSKSLQHLTRYLIQLMDLEETRVHVVSVSCLLQLPHHSFLWSSGSWKRWRRRNRRIEESIIIPDSDEEEEMLDKNYVRVPQKAADGVEETAAEEAVICNTKMITPNNAVTIQSLSLITKWRTYGWFWKMQEHTVFLQNEESEGGTWEGWNYSWKICLVCWMQHRDIWSSRCGENTRNDQRFRAGYKRLAYDGASNMSGKNASVAKLIKNDNPLATYVLLLRL